MNIIFTDELESTEIILFQKRKIYISEKKGLTSGYWNVLVLYCYRKHFEKMMIVLLLFIYSCCKTKSLLAMIKSIREGISSIKKSYALGSYYNLKNIRLTIILLWDDWSIDAYFNFSLVLVPWVALYHHEPSYTKSTEGVSITKNTILNIHWIKFLCTHIYFF